MTSRNLTVSLDEAYSFLIDWSKEILNQQRKGAYNGDIYLNAVCIGFLEKAGISRDRRDGLVGQIGSIFHSAAWELAIKGILRPGERCDPLGSGQHLSAGSLFSITERGKEWLLAENNDQPFAMANSAMVSVVEKLKSRFGLGFHERAIEAIACLENRGYLAACALCGAAIESVLLVTAIKVAGNEEEVLKKYKQAKGREELRKIVIRNDNSLSKHIDPAFAILAYWRDHAAHGEKANLGMNEALVALYTLISLSQFIDSRWETFKTNRQHD